MLKPTLPSYDIQEWQQKPFHERLRMVCQAWALQGYGTPPGVYSFYILKIALYIGLWCFFCSFTPGLGHLGTLPSWWLHPIAFQKAILWSMLFEVLGLGCGSGPLTGRYVPPFGGALYFLRPNTTRMPLWPNVPLLRGHTRTLLDVALYLAHIIFLLRVLLAPQISTSLLIPTLILLPILGLRDKTIYLASRAEHYYTALVCFLFVQQWIPACKWLWLAIWMWAATSKLNAHFPSVIATMTSNSPFTNPFPRLRKLLYRQYPDDLRPSSTAAFMAHFGTAVELSFPLVLLLSKGGTTTTIALGVMLLFHIFITTNVPMGVPIEWNFAMVYGAFFLFGQHAATSAFSLTHPLLIAFLLGNVLLLPLLGNLFPAHISFLLGMRYYAGNWPYNIWLFRHDASDKLESHLVKIAPHPKRQLRLLYDEDTITALLSKVMAFRAMHLQGRAIQLLLPKAVENIDEYEYIDGELIAGITLGWNFGEGHLHNQQLLDAIQTQCNFEEGQLRCIFIEPQPLGRHSLSWTIADAAKGPLQQGQIQIQTLRELQPWPSPPTQHDEIQQKSNT